MDKTVFLDRDGTIIVDKDYLSDPAEVVMETGAGEALSRLARRGYRLIVVTNQSGVSRGYFSLSSVQACNRRVDELLKEYGVTISAWLICPHAPDDACTCRKPGVGLVDQAKSLFVIDLPNSFVVGDKDSDVLLAQATGMKGLLVLTGSGSKYVEWAKKYSHPQFQNLSAAADYICTSNTFPSTRM